MSSMCAAASRRILAPVSTSSVFSYDITKAE